MSAGGSPTRIHHIAIEELRGDPLNPRRISEEELEALTRSIQEFGLVDPVIVRREDKTVIGGHQRLKAARRLGMPTVPVVYVDVSVDRARLLNLALNRISGEWDEEMLARLLADLDETPDADLTLAGFGEDEIQRLLKTMDRRDKRTRVEEFVLEAAWEAVRQDAGVAPGDLFLLPGPAGTGHRLMCGDAAEAKDVARLMAGLRASMAFTDPPYNVDYGTHGGQQKEARRRPIVNDSLGEERWEEFVRNWAANLLKEVDGALYVCMSCKEWPTVSRVLDQLGGHWSTTVIWAKDRFVIGRADYQRQYEPIWYGWREGSRRHWCGDRDQGDVWTIARPAESELHPTMKPIELVERAVENSTRPGDVVLDLFLGSGTTTIAAERTGRTCYGMEIDPRYVRLAIMRWEAFSGLRAERLSPPRGKT